MINERDTAQGRAQDAKKRMAAVIASTNVVETFKACSDEEKYDLLRACLDVSPLPMIVKLCAESYAARRRANPEEELRLAGILLEILDDAHRYVPFALN